MSKLERITVTMPEEMVAKITAAVEAGDYATTSEVVREAIRDWVDLKDRRKAAMTTFRAEIAKGLTDPFHDGETVMRELREYVARLVHEQAQDEAA